MSSRGGRGAASLFVVSVLCLVPVTAEALVPEPPHLLRGTVTVSGSPRSWGTVSLRLTGAPGIIASSAVGSVPGAPSGYLLRIPMDALDPRGAGTAREGDAAEVLLDGTVVAAATVGGRGILQTLDLDLPNPPHEIVFTRGPTALPGAVESGGMVYCDVEAADSLGHALGYLWSASCPGASGSFDDAAAASPVWTAPDATGRNPWTCDLTVAVDDGQGLVEARTVPVLVQPAPSSEPVAVPEAVPNPASCGQTIQFDGTGSWHGDPGRSIVSWEWDFDYDGFTFTPDASGGSVTHSYGGASATFLVALRVTDDGFPPRSSIGTVTVDPDGLNRSPVADAGGPYVASGGGALQLDGGASSDPDAACGDSVTSYSWDLDGDGSFGDAVGAQPLLAWSEVVALVCGGPCEDGLAYPVALRVSDARGGQDTAATTVTPALLVFFDDFSDGTPAGDPDWGVVRGAWTVRGVANKYYRSTSLTAANLTVPLALPDPGPAALRLEARLALLKKYKKYPNGALLFAYQDASHYRYVRLLRKNSFKIVLGQVGTIGAEGPGIKAAKRVRGLALGTWYRLRADAHPDGLVEVFLDDRPKPVLTHPFSAAAPGAVGCHALKARAKFDGFTVWNEGVLP